MRGSTISLSIRPDTLAANLSLIHIYVLAQWIQPQNDTLCQDLGRYFYQQALSQKDSYPYLDYLRQCRWTDCTDLLLSYFKHTKGLHSWSLLRFINEMPGTGQAKAQEVQRLYDDVSQDKLPLQAFGPKEALLETLQNTIFELLKETPVRQ